jgi:hypothetical protein
VRKRVDLISCASDLAAVAAARATQTIPNYLYNVIYPVELGLIDSYVLPGRNPDGASDNGSRSLCSAIACRARSCSARWSSREACCPMVVGDNYVGGRIDSSVLLPVLTRCLT